MSNKRSISSSLQDEARENIKRLVLEMIRHRVQLRSEGIDVDKAYKFFWEQGVEDRETLFEMARVKPGDG